MGGDYVEGKIRVEGENREWIFLEHGQKNDSWWTMPQRTGREAPGKEAEGLLLQVHLVPWIVFRYDFMSPL